MRSRSAAPASRAVTYANTRGPACRRGAGRNRSANCRRCSRSSCDPNAAPPPERVSPACSRTTVQHSPGWPSPTASPPILPHYFPSKHCRARLLGGQVCRLVSSPRWRRYPLWPMSIRGRGRQIARPQSRRVFPDGTRVLLRILSRCPGDSIRLPIGNNGTSSPGVTIPPANTLCKRRSTPARAGRRLRWRCPCMGALATAQAAQSKKRARPSLVWRPRLGGVFAMLAEPPGAPYTSTIVIAIASDRGRRDGDSDDPCAGTAQVEEAACPAGAFPLRASSAAWGSTAARGPSAATARPPRAAGRVRPPPPGAYALLTAFMTYPLVTHFTSHVPGDGGDA